MRAHTQTHTDTQSYTTPAFVRLRHPGALSPRAHQAATRIVITNQQQPHARPWDPQQRHGQAGGGGKGAAGRPALLVARAPLVRGRPRRQATAPRVHTTTGLACASSQAGGSSGNGSRHGGAGYGEPRCTLFQAQQAPRLMWDGQTGPFGEGRELSPHVSRLSPDHPRPATPADIAAGFREPPSMVITKPAGGVRPAPRREGARGPRPAAERCRGVKRPSSGAERRAVLVKATHPPTPSPLLLPNHPVPRQVVTATNR